METHPLQRYLNSLNSTSGSAGNCAYPGNREGGLGSRPGLRGIDRGRGVEKGQATQTVRGLDKASMGRGPGRGLTVSPPCF